MNQTAVELLIGMITFFVTSLANVFVLGMFLGGIKVEMRLMADRLAKIEGAFTMVPRGLKNVGEDLSVLLVCVVGAIPHF